MFQTMKRTLTDKIIVDENLNKIAHNFINAQTVFAKMLAKNTEDMTKYYIDTLVGDDQRKRDLSSFGHQDIVSTACRLIVHAFHADTSGQQVANEPGCDEALPWSRTQNNEVRRGRYQGSKIEVVERFEGLNRPKHRSGLRQHDQTVSKPDRVDLYPVCLVARHGLILLGCGGM